MKDFFQYSKKYLLKVYVPITLYNVMIFKLSSQVFRGFLKIFKRKSSLINYLIMFCCVKQVVYYKILPNPYSTECITMSPSNLSKRNLHSTYMCVIKPQSDMTSSFCLSECFSSHQFSVDDWRTTLFRLRLLTTNFPVSASPCQQ